LFANLFYSKGFPAVTAFHQWAADSHHRFERLGRDASFGLNSKQLQRFYIPLNTARYLAQTLNLRHFVGLVLNRIEEFECPNKSLLRSSIALLPFFQKTKFKN
jgi:hypothetical protein